jgi:hypothetical protein
VAEPADMIVPLLREMRAENATLHQQTRNLIEALERRVGRIEETQISYRQALTADSFLSKLVTGKAHRGARQESQRPGDAEVTASSLHVIA